MRTFLGWVVSFLVLAMVMGTFVATLAPNPAQGWIKDYQTLLGGAFAIIAALVTVIQMRKSDAKSEARHRELVVLQLRADRLALDRLFHGAEELRRDMAALDWPKVTWSRNYSDKKIGETLMSLVEPCRQLQMQVKRVTEFVSSDRYKNTAHLFNGEFQKLSSEYYRAAVKAMQSLGKVGSVGYVFDVSNHGFANPPTKSVRDDTWEWVGSREKWDGTFEGFEAASKAYHEGVNNLLAMYEGK
ncbi:hypothetical protein AUSSIE_17 [Sinorhizobium phage Aussie]|nr:hypothetical protein AUSSIE_17 [Sinorhizobium phage Aussie]